VTEPDNPILTAWQGILARFGPEPAIRGASGEVLRTFAAIELESVQLAPLFDSDRLPPHSVVAVRIGNSERWPELLLALWRRDLIPLPLGDMGASELAVTLDTCRAAALVTNEGGPLSVQNLPMPAEGANRWPEPAPQFLKLTSGTTCVPRAVRFRARQLLSDAENICATMGLTETDVNYGVIPLSHSYGFSNLVTPLLVRGVRLVVSNDRFPRAILDGLAASEATVFPATPVFFQKLAELESPRRLDKLRLCISAGAQLPRQAAALFTAKFGLKIHAFYGSSECGGIAYDAADDRQYEDGFVGTPMRGVEIAHADFSGPIAVSGPAVGDGYFPENDEAALGGGKFVPGDIVQRTDRGLYLVGRTSEIINVAGRKLNPLEVEARLAEYPGVRQAVVFGVQSALRGEEPVACVAGDDLGREALLRFCHEKLSPWQVPRDLWFVGEIPSTERGKINRRAVAESYRAQLQKP
jgi:long-chain acyl-CoA synthetase